MLETLLDRHIMIAIMGILAAAGIVSKCIANIALKRLIRAAGNMNKSNHSLMRLVRAKFEHVSMISDKVENVRVFVDKYLYEYKVLGLKLHSWRRMEKTSAGLCLIAGAAGAALEYGVNGMSSAVWKVGAIGGGLAAFVFLVHLMTDEKYQMEAVRNYMVDYLENVCRHKYEKSNQKEIKILAQEGTAADFASIPADSPGNAGEAYDTAYAAKEPAAAGDSYTAREQASARGTYASQESAAVRETYAAREQDASRESYPARNQERVREPYVPAKGQSAVSAFLAAELKAGETSDTVQTAGSESGGNAGLHRVDREETDDDGVYRAVRGESDKSAGTYRTVRTEPEKRTEAYQAVELEPGEIVGAFRVAESEHSEENIVEIPKPEPVKEALAAAASDSSEYSGQLRSPAQRPTKKPRREKTAEEVDKDIVIRRILEEFMA